MDEKNVNGRKKKKEKRVRNKRKNILPLLSKDSCLKLLGK